MILVCVSFLCVFPTTLVFRYVRRICFLRNVTQYPPLYSWKQNSAELRISSLKPQILEHTWCLKASWSAKNTSWHEMETNSKTLGCLSWFGKIWVARIEYPVSSGSNELEPGTVFFWLSQRQGLHTTRL